MEYLTISIIGRTTSIFEHLVMHGEDILRYGLAKN